MINRYFPLKYTTFSHWFKFICKCLCCLLHVIVFVHIRNKGQLFLKDSSKSVKKWTDWENVKLSFLSLGTINLFCSRNMSSICYWHKSVFYIVNISFQPGSQLKQFLFILVSIIMTKIVLFRYQRDTICN